MNEETDTEDNERKLTDSGSSQPRSPIYSAVSSDQVGIVNWQENKSSRNYYKSGSSSSKCMWGCE